MKLLRPLALSFTAALAACSGEATQQALYQPQAPPPVAPAPSAPSIPATPEPPPRKFTGDLKSDAVVALAAAGAPASYLGTTEALARQRDAALACFTGSAPKVGKIWFASRVSAAGALEDVRAVTSDATPEQTACATAAIAKASFVPQGGPVAISFTLRFEPEKTASEGAAPPDASRATSATKPSSTPAPPRSPGPSAPADEQDPLSARGNMWGDAIGDSFGEGGLGLSGGGGRGEGIGLGSIGTLGHGAGTGTGQGFGNGHGRLKGSHRNKPPSIRMGATSVSGRLPPEVIQRIVRQQFGRFRLCYENGLRSDPNLMGRVAVKFTIGRDGAVTEVGNGGSDLPDKGVVSCVVRAFGGLSFPEPEGGVVKVVYPIMFSPGEGGPTKPAKPAPRKSFTVGKKKLQDLDGSTVASLVSNDERQVATVTLADQNAGWPFVVFVRIGDEVFAVTRLNARAKGFEPVVDGEERITPDNWVLRVEGPSPVGSHNLLVALIDS